MRLGKGLVYHYVQLLEQTLTNATLLGFKVERMVLLEVCIDPYFYELSSREFCVL